MATIVLPILIALTVGMAGWGIASAMSKGGQKAKRKLKQRLSSEARVVESNAHSPRQITLQLEVVGVPKSLVKLEFVQGVNRKLQRVYPATPAGKFFKICIAFAVTAGVVATALSASFGFGLVATLGGFMLPVMFLSMRAAARQKLLVDQLPEALDFLSRILRAGHSLSTGLQMMGEELPQPIAREFRRTYDEHSLGQPMEDCLKNLAARVESTDVSFFITAVLIQRQTGGDLSEVLDNISEMIRGRIRLQNHVKAKTAEGRFTGYILVAFPAVMFFLSWSLNPEYPQVLLHTSGGQQMLGAAAVLCVLGLIAIKKLTTVKV